MSGGVDSSVSAALLKKQGFEVEGVFMKFWSEPESKDPESVCRQNLCCSKEAEEAARQVAEKLGIPFKVLDFSREFKKEVVDYFLAEQKKGRTPNPCVVCNKKIKFGLLFDYAQKMKADFLASGHYVDKIKSKGVFKIKKAKDQSKDQTYFLYRLNQKQLSKLIFPAGDILKEDIYKIAKKLKLPYWRAESFDLCFARSGAESFVKKYLKLVPGEIRNLDGEILGRHEGLAIYTIGQRKRIPVAQGPWRGGKKDERKNILFVSNDEKDLYSSELKMARVNWTSGQAPEFPLRADVKIRYKSKPARAMIEPIDKSAKKLKVKFSKPQFAATPGQSAVFYKGKELLGGGVIE